MTPIERRALILASDAKAVHAAVEESLRSIAIAVSSRQGERQGAAESRASSFSKKETKTSRE